MSVTPIYDSGDTVRVSAIFSDSGGTALDPAVVKFQCLADALQILTTLTHGVDAALVKEATGHYYVDIDSTESPGSWRWRFYSTGTGQAAAEDQFYVRPSAVGTVGTLSPSAQITSIAAGAGISVAINVSGIATITNTGVHSLAGTANEIDVSAAVGAITVSLPDNVGIGIAPHATARLHVFDSSYARGMIVGVDPQTAASADMGLRLLPFSDGHIYIDAHTAANKFLVCRIGAGGQAGTANNWLTVTAASGQAAFPLPTSFGFNPAQSDQIRLPNTGWITARNAANDNDIRIVAVNNNNLIAFGRARTSASIPANFTADFWIQFQDVNGNHFFIPGKNAAW